MALSKTGRLLSKAAILGVGVFSPLSNRTATGNRNRPNRFPRNRTRNRHRRNRFPRNRNRNRNRPLYAKTPSLEEPREPKTGTARTVPSPNRNRTEPNRGHPAIFRMAKRQPKKTETWERKWAISASSKATRICTAPLE